jgi:hypothetical protein
MKNRLLAKWTEEKKQVRMAITALFARQAHTTLLPFFSFYNKKKDAALRSL